MVSSLINPISLCEAALGLHPIGSISKVKGYASNLLPLFQPLLGVSFSCLNLHAFLNSGSWATRVSATLRAGAPGPPARQDFSPALWTFPLSWPLAFHFHPILCLFSNLMFGLQWA